MSVDPQVDTEAVRTHRANARSHARWGGVPLAMSLALVAFAVIFGIYGPRVVDRVSPPLGIPAWDLGEAALRCHFERVGAASHHSRSADIETMTVAEAEDDLSANFGMHVRVPDLSGANFTLHRPVPIALPGTGAGILLFYTRNAVGGPDTVSIIVVPDREQYVVFSPFGRPLFLPAWELYPIDLLTDDGREASAFVWSDGSFIRVALARTPAILSEVKDAVVPSMRARGSQWS